MTRMHCMAIALIALGACAKANDDTTAVNAVRNAYAAAWKTGDAAKVAALYDANAVTMQQGAATTEGGIAIASALGAQFAEMTPTDIVLSPLKTEVGEDIAYDYGTYQYSGSLKNGGAPVSGSGRYLVVLKRQSDDSWKIITAMDNSATPEQLATPSTPAPATTTSM